GIQKATIQSPRGTYKMSRAGNPIQDIYLREVKNKENRVLKVAIKGLADPAKGCKL
ncbi:MAG: ABC transporter permease, partial [Gammaproteobacteria bacterium]|nr:ABC transporter permease [Gammaproteobacteria bacterium]